MTGELRPRILRLPIGEADAGKTIKEYLMRKVGFSSKQLSRFKYRKDGILLNGEKRYVNAPLQAGDVLEIRLTRGGEPVEEHPHDALQRTSGESCAAGSGKGPAVGNPAAESGKGPAGEGRAAAPGYLAARDGRLQKIWAPPAAWLSKEYPLQILYEDEDILAADKPSGVVCHPSPGHFDDTLSNQVAEHLGRTGQELDVRVTGRLDRDTSGIVIFALNTETAAQLIKQRQAQRMHKLYIARVQGHFGGCASGTVDAPLRRESRESFRMVTAQDGKPARTHYRVLLELEDGTALAACRIEHGRTHQIRVHMASIGHPLVGDRLYGGRLSGPDGSGRTQGPEKKPGGTVPADLPQDEADGPVLMLHAYRARLVQPFTGEEVCLEAPLPEWADALRGWS